MAILTELALALALWSIVSPFLGYVLGVTRKRAKPQEMPMPGQIWGVPGGTKVRVVEVRRKGRIGGTRSPWVVFVQPEGRPDERACPFVPHDVFLRQSILQGPHLQVRRVIEAAARGDGTS